MKGVLLLGCRFSGQLPLLSIQIGKKSWFFFGKWKETPSSKNLSIQKNTFFAMLIWGKTTLHNMTNAKKSAKNTFVQMHYFDSYAKLKYPKNNMLFFSYHIFLLLNFLLQIFSSSLFCVGQQRKVIFCYTLGSRLEGHC